MLLDLLLLRNMDVFFCTELGTCFEPALFTMIQAGARLHLQTSGCREVGVTFKAARPPLSAVYASIRAWASSVSKKRHPYLSGRRSYGIKVIIELVNRSQAKGIFIDIR
jgi:hypothetical protein